MNNAILAGMSGFIMPYIVEFIKVKLPKTKGKWLGYLLSYGICVLVGVGTAFSDGKFESQNILSSAGAALIVSQGVYNLYFKPKKIDERIKKALK